MTKLIHINNCYKHIDLLKQNNLVNDEVIVNMLCANIMHNKDGSCNVGVDRTVSNKVNYLNAPIPEIKAIDVFENIMLARADKIWKIGKPIKFFWSGGIDSTAALVALIKTNSEWYKSIEVINTFNEYIFFSETFIKPHNCFLDLSNNKKILTESSFYNDDYTYVTGDHGDQIFGPGLLKVPGGIGMRNSPISIVYSGFIDFICKKVIEKNSHYEIIKNFMLLNMQDTVKQWTESFVSRCPIKLNTFFDFMWWVNFVLRWHEKKSFKYVGKIGDISIVNKMQSFFDDENLQIWAIINNNERIYDPYDWKTFKQPLKDFIFSFTSDENYRVNFMKQPSKIVDDTTHKIVYADSDGFTTESFDKLTSIILSKTINP